MAFKLTHETVHWVPETKFQCSSGNGHAEHWIRVIINFFGVVFQTFEKVDFCQYFLIEKAEAEMHLVDCHVTKPKLSQVNCVYFAFLKVFLAIPFGLHLFRNRKLVIKIG